MNCSEPPYVIGTTVDFHLANEETEAWSNWPKVTWLVGEALIPTHAAWLLKMCSSVLAYVYTTCSPLTYKS